MKIKEAHQGHCQAAQQLAVAVKKARRAQLCRLAARWRPHLSVDRSASIAKRA
jgi:hypothetical protein